MLIPDIKIKLRISSELIDDDNSAFIFSVANEIPVEVDKNADRAGISISGEEENLIILEKQSGGKFAVTPEYLQFVRNYRDDIAGNLRKSLFDYLPVNYQTIPPWLRMPLAKLLTRLFSSQNAKSGKANLFFDIVDYILINLGLTPVASENKNEMPLLTVTVDVDSTEGLKFCNEMERCFNELNISAAWFFTGALLKKHTSYVEKISELGYEIGLHGFIHDNRLTALSRDEIRRKFDDCERVIEQFKIKFFRAPSFRLSNCALDVLAERKLHDSSFCDSISLYRYAGTKPACTSKPFITRGVLVAPVTIPWDMALKIVGNEEKLPLYWKEKINILKVMNGVATILIHPEPHLCGNIKRLKVFKRSIEKILAAGFKKSAICNIITP